MRHHIRRRQHEVPELNMAALPDLIFTVLFFFMIVTHMRDVEKKVNYEIPAGQKMEQVGHQKNVIYIYIGKPTDGSSADYQVQLGNRIASVADIPAFIKQEHKQMSAEDQERMTVCIRADRGTPMKLIGEVKQQLRNAYALSVTYSAVNLSTNNKQLKQ
jgi:biopolymer transport protein ExbD